MIIGISHEEKYIRLLLSVQKLEQPATNKAFPERFHRYHGCP